MLAEHSPHKGIRSLLRDATRPDHEMIDQMMSQYDLTQRLGYGAFLNVHYAALLTLQFVWRANDQADFLNMTQCLHDDLISMGIASAKPSPQTFPPLSSRNRLGIEYVVRGSRLGSAVLRRRVPSNFATAYLDFEPSTAWPVFLLELERSASEDSSNVIEQVICGAKMAFSTFRVICGDQSVRDSLMTA
jgi:heme oxygenase